MHREPSNDGNNWGCSRLHEQSIERTGRIAGTNRDVHSVLEGAGCDAESSPLLLAEGLVRHELDRSVHVALQLAKAPKAKTATTVENGDEGIVILTRFHGVVADRGCGASEISQTGSVSDLVITSSTSGYPG